MFDRINALVRSVWHWRRLDTDMDDEMRFHVERYQGDLMANGMPADEAAERALLAFGRVGRLKEECREAKGWPMVDEFLRNVAYALRQLRRSPAFAAAVIVSLGLCIGVNTAVFSVIDAVLLRPLPYPEPDRLCEVIRELRRGAEMQASNAQDGYAWDALKDARNFQLAVSGSASGVNLAIGNRAIYVQQHRVSANYFRVLNVPLAFGRELNREEDRPGGPAAVVLSHGIWKKLFAGDASIVGQAILLKGEPHTVVGITGETFQPRGAIDVWTPLRPSIVGEGGGFNYTLLGRLKPGVTWSQAQAEAQTLGVSPLERMKIPKTMEARLTLAPLEETSQANLRTRLFILSGAAAVVLLIGCVNIASLMLARGTARRREIGTRIALGGGYGSLLRQLTTESLVLGTIGGAAGITLGFVVIAGLQKVVANYGIWQELRLDLRVLLMTAFLSLLVSLLFGCAPALQAAGVDVRNVLLEGGSRTAAGGRSHWLRRTLVLVQVALSLMLLVGAGLLIRTMLNLQLLSPGFDGTNVLTATASLQDARYQPDGTVNRLFRDSLQAIRNIRGIDSAAVGLHVPYQRWLNSGVKVRNSNAAPEREVGTSVNYVSPEFFKTLRIPVRAGRVFNEGDTESSLPVAIVNETFARKYLASQDPSDSYVGESTKMRQIVAVVSDLQQQPGLSSSGPLAQEPALYLPVTQVSGDLLEMAHTWYSPSWVIKAARPRAELTRAIEAAIATVDPLLPIANFRSMTEERDSALKSQKMNAWLLSAVAVLALSLAMVGVYGMVANSVVERRREFGIRLALGSSPRKVILGAIAPGILLTSIGVAVGAFFAALSVRTLSSLLYGVQPLDAPTFLLTALLLIGTSVSAGLIPAMSLLKLSPGNVLRQE